MGHHIERFRREGEKHAVSSLRQSVIGGNVLVDIPSYMTFEECLLGIFWRCWGAHFAILRALQVKSRGKLSSLLVDERSHDGTLETRIAHTVAAHPEHIGLRVRCRGTFTRLLDVVGAHAKPGSS